VLTNSSPISNFLYQAYVGRVTTSGGAFSVLVGGNPMRTGTNSTLAGITNRTWYDGISYAKVDALNITSVSNTPTSITVTWNSPRPEASLTAPSYTLWKKAALTDAVWTPVATGIPSSGFSTSYTDSLSGDTAFYRVSWP